MGLRWAAGFIFLHVLQFIAVCPALANDIVHYVPERDISINEILSELGLENDPTLATQIIQMNRDVLRARNIAPKGAAIQIPFKQRFKNAETSPVEIHYDLGCRDKPIGDLGPNLIGMIERSKRPVKINFSARCEDQIPTVLASHTNPVRAKSQAKPSESNFWNHHEFQVAPIVVYTGLSGTSQGGTRVNVASNLGYGIQAAWQKAFLPWLSTGFLYELHVLDFVSSTGGTALSSTSQFHSFEIPTQIRLGSGFHASQNLRLRERQYLLNSSSPVSLESQFTFDIGAGAGYELAPARNYTVGLHISGHLSLGKTTDNYELQTGYGFEGTASAKREFGGRHSVELQFQYRNHAQDSNLVQHQQQDFVTRAVYEYRLGGDQ